MADPGFSCFNCAVKNPFAPENHKRLEKIHEAIARISLEVESAPADSEGGARRQARDLRNAFMAALPELGAHATIVTMGPVIRRFRRHAEAKGLDVSTEIYHVYLAVELLDRPLEHQAHEMMLLAIGALRAEPQTN